MISLTGSRVIVVDDEEKDALPILKAFAQRGIPAAYFDGNPNELPPENQSLTGVRLAILDMDLLGGGTDEKSKASALVSLLATVLSRNNGPYAVLIWTNYPHLRDYFERYLFSSSHVPKPIFIVMITKVDYKKPDGSFDFPQLSKRIQEALSEFSPLQFLLAWEEKCFMSSTEVTNTLSNLATNNNITEPENWRSIWKSQILKLMYAMAKEAYGEKIDKDSVLNGFYGSLNPLHTDRMESNTGVLSRIFGQHSDEILQASEDCGIESKAKINTMLHLAFENLDFFSAGNIYMFSTNRNPEWVPSTQELLKELMNKTKWENTKSKKEISNSSSRIIAEISAVCDHAQGNIRIPRFICGLIVPVNMYTWIRKADFIWKFGPLFLNQTLLPSSQYYLFFSSRHSLSLDFNKIKGMNAFARLRGQALSSLQYWHSHHLSRPGMMLLR